MTTVGDMLVFNNPRGFAACRGHLFSSLTFTNLFNLHGIYARRIHTSSPRSAIHLPGGLQQVTYPLPASASSSVK